MKQRNKQLRLAMNLNREDYPDFSDIERWNIGDVLAECIHDGLKKFYLAKRDGYPVELGSYDNWNHVLKEMIWAFNEIAKNNPNEPYTVAYEKALREHPEWFDSSIEHEKLGLSNMDEESSKALDRAHKEYNERIQNGLNLFAKYFQDLWD